MKKRNLHFLSLHSMILKYFKNIFMFILLLFLVVIITFTVGSPHHQICILAYLSDCFPIVISSILFLLFYLEKPFQYFFQNGFSIAVLFQLLFVGEILYFSFYFKRYSCQIEHSRLQIFSFQHFKYILPLLSGLQCFCREIS